MKKPKSRVNSGFNLPNDFGKYWRRGWEVFAAAGMETAKRQLLSILNSIYGAGNEKGS
jgi:hypothetical protein